MNKKTGIFYAIITIVLWGVWGAFIEIPEKAGFPATLGYSVWALTMIPVALFAMHQVSWKLDNDRVSAAIGMAAGLMGCGGQLILFQCLRLGPAYIIFPIISLYPVVTIILSLIFLREKAGRNSWIGIVLALIAILLLSYQPPENTTMKGYVWLLLSMVVFLLWGVQAYLMKLGSSGLKSRTVKPESFTVYTMISAIVLIPFAILMTDVSQPINWGFHGLVAAAFIQSFNAVGYLFFAYSIRYGKAIIVVPLMSLAPVVTVILSLIIYSVIPHPVIITGMILAFISIYILSRE